MALLRRGVLFVLAAWLAFGSVAAAQQLTTAPKNPEFTKYQQELQERTRVVERTPEGYALSLIPEPRDLSRLRSADLTPFHESYPATYDLRTIGGVTAIRDQNPWGTCWSFAAYASLESTILRSAESSGRDQGAAFDFSEKNMVNLNGFDRPSPIEDAGGNATMASAYLTRWQGAVSEAADPYPSGTWSASPAGLPSVRHVQQVLWFPGKTLSPLNVDSLKYAVTNYGAVHTSMYWSNGSFNEANDAFYYNVAGSGTNHAVAIVGWDDNYPAANFNTAPPGNGAFLIRNSWGTWWGQQGYFWLSYYDTRHGSYAVAFNKGESVNNYQALYQYDPFGDVTYLGFKYNNVQQESMWGANIFTASANHSITAVSLYTIVDNGAYEVYVYKDVTAGQPRSGTLVTSVSGTTPISGYHTITLPAPVPVTAGSRFSVVVKFISPGYGWPLPIEYPDPGWSSGVVANPGESFYSGFGDTWSDLDTAWNSNVCIKAFAAAPPPTPGDFNGDGKADIVWRQRSTGNVVFWYMNGATQIGNAPMSPAPTNTDWQLAGVGDFDGDGKPDILFRNLTSGMNEIALMNGPTVTSGGFTATLSNLDWVVGGTGDVNGDGKADIVWRNMRTGENGVWYMNGLSVLGSAAMPTVSDTAWQISAVADFNSDGKPDIVWRNTTSGEVIIRFMNGTVQGGYVRLSASIDTAWHIVQAGDFDGDGDPDILWRHPSTGENGIWRMNGASLLGWDGMSSVATDWDVNHPPLAPPAPPLLTVPNDFNADGMPDILWRNTSTGENIVWFMNGVAKTSHAALLSFAGPTYRPAAAVDFNADGKTDILWRNGTTGENVVWYMNGAVKTSHAVMATVPAAWRMAGAADFNSDGKPDLLWRNPSTGENIVWFMNGIVKTSHASLPTVADGNWWVEGTADLTGDGKPDVLWRNNVTGENIVWQMNGTARVANIRLNTIADTLWTAPQLSDFNKDGKTDILWRHATTGENIVWYMNGTTYTGYGRVATVPIAWIVK